MTKNTVLKAVIPLLILTLSSIGFALMFFLKKPPPITPPTRLPIVVEVMDLEKVDFQFRIQSQGTIQAANAIRLISEVDGKVIYVSQSLKTGGGFEEGDLLVKLDSRDYDFAQTRAKAQVASAKLRLARAEAEAKLAGEDWELLGKKAEATALLLHQPQLTEARSTLAAAQADLSKARLDLQRTQITSPFKGRVQKASVEVGQFVRRGEELATLFSVDRVEVALPLALSAFEFLDLPKSTKPEAFSKNPTKVRLVGQFGTRTHQWKAELVRVGAEVNVNSRMGIVFASVSDPYEFEGDLPPLRIGTFVEAEIVGKTARDVFVIPRVFLWGKKKALAVDQDGFLRIRDLMILRINRDQAIVKEGFEKGDRLCVSTIELPQDGVKVNVIKRE